MQCKIKFGEGLKRWFREENIQTGDKISISYDPLQPLTNRVRIEIHVAQRIIRPTTTITPVIAPTTIDQTIAKTLIEEEKGREEYGITIDKKQFAYEEDLRNFLVRNLSELEQRLKLY